MEAVLNGKLRQKGTKYMRKSSDFYGRFFRMEILPPLNSTKIKKGEKKDMIYTIDSIMGTGKTMAMIDKINNSGDETRWLYITPYLNEVDRIVYLCSPKQFCAPKAYGNKVNGFISLLKLKRNIICTHALFNHLTPEIMNQLYEYNYTLVIDEVLENISQIKVTKYDANILKASYFDIDDDGLVKWKDADYRGMFCTYKDLADTGRLYRCHDSGFLSIFPYKELDKFKDVYILTYMFDAQIMKYMLDINKMGYIKMSAEQDGENFRFIPYKNTYDTTIYKNNIHILEDKKLNAIGEEMYSLSANWYKKVAKNGGEEFAILRNNCYNFFMNKVGVKTADCLWTSFKSYSDDVSRKGFKKGFLAQNARATNEYSSRTAVAYTVNQYMNLPVKVFLNMNGVSVNEDAYALSNMLQFIWRSAIREGEQIDVYVPSSRMRGLLYDFISGNNHLNDTPKSNI